MVATEKSGLFDKSTRVWSGVGWGVAIAVGALMGATGLADGGVVAETNVAGLKTGVAGLLAWVEK